MSCLQSLTHLEIYYCPNLTTLPNDMCSFQFLTHLEIYYCINLTSLPNDMYFLESLIHLVIVYCQNLTSLPNNMCRLKSLTALIIKSCPNLVDVSFSLEHFPSLKEIEVNDCDQWIRNWSNDAISRICSIEKRSWISICSEDDDIDLLSRWLRKKIDSTKILDRLQIMSGGHGNRFF
ncbi:hypothetical protein ZOSMA_6G01760 [Zostera marina]|uniref:Uncharacterized protein n=1 Tax=Zostera marina TaxID=29655 RepID=A0A0K9NT69_ZOSMR|nr:hypothetical protein ZOSMA_6G01760 [Zostera marina]